MRYICLPFFASVFYKCQIWFRFSINNPHHYGYNNINIYIHVQYLCVICTIVFHLYFCTCTICTFHFYFKVPLKNIKRVIPEEDVFDVIHKYHNIMNNQSCSKTTYHQVNKSTLWGIFVYLFLQVFSISVGGWVLCTISLFLTLKKIAY